jgi:hypothetical protein
MRSKENVGVSDHVRSSLKTPQAAEPLTEARISCGMTFYKATHW